MTRPLSSLGADSGDATYEESKRLARHDDPVVRANLARRTDVRAEILYYLAEDEVAAVRRGIAANMQTPRQADLLLARAANAEQASRVGNQSGGRVFIFLYTDDFYRDYEAYRARGVVFIRPPSDEPYGIVAVFEDLYGNKWDLVQMKQDSADARPGH